MLDFSSVSKGKKLQRSPPVRDGSPNRTGAGPELTPARRWMFRAGAAIVLPLLALGLLEAGLRLGGFGYPTSFFLARQINGRAVFVENDKFGLRFFPPELARSPSPLVMPAVKSKDTCRIFVLGESAALGDPEPAFGFGRYLQVLLEERFPGRRFEVVCAAMTAINSHAILPIARECARHQGDVWVVYMGNNEFVGPFGPSTIFGSQLPPLSLIRLDLALKETRLGQLLARLSSRSLKGKTWGGMKMFLDHQVGPEDPRKARVYDYFRANLEDILAAGRRAGVQVVLSTVVANLKDCPPFGSSHRPALSPTQLEQWQKYYQAATDDQKAGQFGAASSNYQAAAQLDPSFAELQFRWARCFLAVTNPAEAARHFALARDCDSLPFRADTRLNEVISSAAARHLNQGVTLVDAAAVLAKQSPQGIPGGESLFEHVHLNWAGNYHLALAVAQSVEKLVPVESDHPVSAGWASADECARRLALTVWDRRRVYESLLRRLEEPPFVGQIDHAQQIDAVQQTVRTLRLQETRDRLQDARALYREATRTAPEDFYLRADFAKLEEDTGNLAEAVRQWNTVRDLLPFAPGPHFYLGRVLGREGKTDAALQELSLALKKRPDLPEALEEKGRLLAEARRPQEALPLLDKAAELEPGNARVCVDRANALAQTGRREEALDQLRRAVALQPGYAEARYLLGVELAFQGDIRSAAEQFLETVRLSPNYAPGHLNLGIALAKLNRLEQAEDQFEQTLRLDPQNQKAAQYLAALKANRRPR